VESAHLGQRGGADCGKHCLRCRSRGIRDRLNNTVNNTVNNTATRINQSTQTAPQVGTETVTGHRWVPSRDPKQLPLCTKCKDIYDTYRMFNDGLNETPND
jgi:hypothetical protein